MDSLPVAPQAYADEFDGCEIVAGILVVSGGDAAELLDAVEEALDEVALTLEPGRKSEALLAFGTVGNIRPVVPHRRGSVDRGTVVTFVAQECGALGNNFDKGFSLTGVVNLSARQSQADTTSISVDKSVEFGRKAAPETSHAMISSSPFLPIVPCW